MCVNVRKNTRNLYSSDWKNYSMTVILTCSNQSLEVHRGQSSIGRKSNNAVFAVNVTEEEPPKPPPDEDEPKPPMKEPPTEEPPVKEPPPKNS